MKPIEHWTPAEYGDACASFYDQLYPNLPRGLVPCLATLARGGLALELGLATGRVALPLRAAGVAVHGIEASAPMIGEFRSRPAARSVSLVRGDFSALPYRGRFRLIFSLVNTLTLLPSRALQAQCVHQIAGLLGDDGTFLAEGSTSEYAAEPQSHDYPIQTSEGLRGYRVTALPLPPQVLDTLADSAGLRLFDRWGSWDQIPFVDGSGHHISLYRSDRPAA